LRVEFSVASFTGWAKSYGKKVTTFMDAQKAFVIKQGEESTPVAEICRKAGFSQGDLLQLEEEIHGTDAV
jgi:putative transposase